MQQHHWRAVARLLALERDRSGAGKLAQHLEARRLHGGVSLGRGSRRALCRPQPRAIGRPEAALGAWPAQRVVRKQVGRRRCEQAPPVDFANHEKARFPLSYPSYPNSGLTVKPGLIERVLELASAAARRAERDKRAEEKRRPPNQKD